MVTGISFAITSVFSGLVIGRLGMGWALYGSVALVAVALVHLMTIHFQEPEPEPKADEPATPSTSAGGLRRSAPCRVWAC